MTNDIIKLMYERDHVHARSTQSNDSKSWQDYHNLRNKVTCIIKKRINSCFNCIHTLYRNNPKTMWLKIKQPVPGKNKHSHITCDISVNDFNQHLPILASKWTQNLDTFFWRGPKSIHNCRFKRMSNNDSETYLRSLSLKSNNDILGMNLVLLK